MAMNPISRIAMTALCLMISSEAWPRIYSQKFELKKLGFQFRSNNNSEKKCLSWFPVNPEDTQKLKFTKAGDPYLLVAMRAKVVSVPCVVKFVPETSVEETQSPVEGERTFLVRVTPPVTTVLVEGPDFKDELIFDAPVEKFEGVGFFSFFGRTQVLFDTRFSQLTTNNPDFSDYKSNVFPVFGGSLGVPFPWYNDVIFSYSLYQSLGNWAAGSGIPVELNEFAFGLRYRWLGKESWGRPSLSVVGDYRGRTTFQPGVDEADRPFVVGSYAMLGFGTEVSWYFGATLADWDSPWSRLGIDFLSRHYLSGTISGRDTTASLYEGILMYRLGKKWSLGAGVSKGSVKTNFEEIEQGSVTEGTLSYLVRFSLVPYIQGGSR